MTSESLARSNSDQMGGETGTLLMLLRFYGIVVVAAAVFIGLSLTRSEFLTYQNPNLYIEAMREHLDEGRRFIETK